MFVPTYQFDLILMNVKLNYMKGKDSLLLKESWQKIEFGLLVHERIQKLKIKYSFFVHQFRTGYRSSHSLVNWTVEMASLLLKPILLSCKLKQWHMSTQ